MGLINVLAYSGIDMNTVVSLQCLASRHIDIYSKHLAKNCYPILMNYKCYNCFRCTANCLHVYCKFLQLMYSIRDALGLKHHVPLLFCIFPRSFLIPLHRGRLLLWNTITLFNSRLSSK